MSDPRGTVTSLADLQNTFLSLNPLKGTALLRVPELYFYPPFNEVSRSRIMLDFSRNGVREILDVIRKQSSGQASLENIAQSNQMGIDSSSIENLEADIYLVESLLAHIRRNRNSLLPIFRLPREVLCVIFQEVQDGAWSCSERYRVIKQLAEVSSYWFSTVLTTPQLWSNIDNMVKYPSVNTIVQRSKGSTINIRLHDAKITELEETMKIIVPHADRWGRFQISSESSLDILLHMRDDITLPWLEHFEISAPYEGEEVPNSIRSQVPRLRTLCIVPFSFPFNSPALTSLQRLEFTPVIQGMELSPLQWQTLLCSCPQLEYIDAKAMPGMKRIGRSFPPFHALMPNLRTISLSSLPVSTIGALISSICVPPGTRPCVRFSAFPNQAEGANILFPIPSQPQSLLWLIRLTSYLSALWGAFHGMGADVYAVDRSTIDLQFAIVNRQSVPAVRVVEALVLPHGLPNLRSLYLSGTQLFQDATVVRIVSQCPKLSKLEMICPNRSSNDVDYQDNLREICEALSSPSVLEGPQAGWLLPELEELKIITWNGFEALLPFVEKRYGSGESPHVIRPRPLKVFQLEYPQTRRSHRRLMDPAHVQRLREILDAAGTKVQIELRDKS